VCVCVCACRLLENKKNRRLLENVISNWQSFLAEAMFSLREKTKYVGLLK
jgi:hypothetical protein